MDKFTIRPAEEKDFPTLARKFELLNQSYTQVGYLLPQPENVGEIWLQSFQRTLGRFSNVFIAEIGSTQTSKNKKVMIGFALCRLKRLPAHMGGLLVGELSDIWVDDKARRLGVGKSLAETVITWLRNQDAHSVEVQVLSNNEPAQALFNTLGFVLEYRSSRLVFAQADEKDGGISSLETNS